DWLAGVAPGRGLAVDVATGSGQAALALAERFERVVAVDQSAELVASVPEHPRLTTQVADAAAFDARDADLVTVFQALHWFVGDAFFDRVRATLRPGGVFAAVCYGWFHVDADVDAVIEGRLLPTIHPHWSPRNHLLFDGYRSVAVPFVERDAPAFAITLAWTRPQLIAYLGTWSAVARIGEVEGRDVLAEIAPLLAEVWPDEGARTVTMPISMRVFTR
ncbi:MAG: class I SAM-dependent methyltransferase, partial [Myxococcota bacterium]